MRSIVQALGTQEFPRLRVGIGSAADEQARDFVLGDFSGDELTVFEDARDRAVEAIETFLARGITVAMNRFNT
jgi:PTH1 family peptidyl-tRNA hydrolase